MTLTKTTIGLHGRSVERGEDLPTRRRYSTHIEVTLTKTTIGLLGRSVERGEDLQTCRRYSTHIEVTLTLTKTTIWLLGGSVIKICTFVCKNY